jgi:cellulose synthase operon protein C
MTAACDALRVHALVDGALDAPRAETTRRHLGGCSRCQQVFEEVLLLDALGAGLPPPRGTVELDAMTEQPRPPPPRRPRRWTLAAAPGLALAAGLVLWWGLRADPDQGAAAVFAALAQQPRQHEWRLSYPAADRYRVYDGPRAGAAKQPARLLDLSTVERTGQVHALAAAQLLVGMPRQAEARLATLPVSADVLNDRAVAALARDDVTAARALLDQALALRPDHRQALWNRALVSERLGDAAAAARLFERVAALGESGWAAEAKARAAKK